MSSRIEMKRLTLLLLALACFGCKRGIATRADAGEASLRSALRGRPQMLGRVTFALVNSSHGRFLFRPSAVAKFLQGES